MNELVAQLGILSGTTFLVVEVFVRALDMLNIKKSPTRSLFTVLVAVIVGSLMSYTSPEYLALFENSALEPYPWFVAILGGIGIGTGSKGVNLVVDIMELAKKWLGVKIIDESMLVAERSAQQNE